MNTIKCESRLPPFHEIGRVCIKEESLICFHVKVACYTLLHSALFAYVLKYLENKKLLNYELTFCTPEQNLKAFYNLFLSRVNGIMYKPCLCRKIKESLHLKSNLEIV